ncbi:MAG: pyroglutamyl-peptidase I [Burkholderiaceae bacterium]|jgi:pyroglutamyl-peptidase|nr:pyroglutamyl-peptidase I [Burkholderiaceae bacterium]
MSAPVLITGFEPFGGETINPSWEVAHRLDGWRCEGTGVRAVRLPCVIGAARDELNAAIDAVQPCCVIALGQAGGRGDITPERIAINIDDARIPDNAGAQPIDVPVIARGPAAYFSTLPIKAMVRALRTADIPASVSNSAGTFVCNHVFYALMHRLAQGQEGRGGAGVQGGFVHVPYLPQQASRLGEADAPPSLALEVMVRALRIMVRVALTVCEDLRESGGAIS